MGIGFGNCQETQWQFAIMFGSKAIKCSFERSHYQIPTLEDILPQLANAKVFSVAYVRNGYWHVPLDRKSQKLTTFGTPFGRYCWRRMPFGISVASEIFQQRLQEAIENLDGVFAIADDILIAGNGITYAET